MSLLKWLKKIFEIKPVQPKVKSAPVVNDAKVVEVTQPTAAVEPELNVLKEGCVVEPETAPEVISNEVPHQPLPKKKRTRKPRKPKDYNG